MCFFGENGGDGGVSALLWGVQGFSSKMRCMSADSSKL